MPPQIKPSEPDERAFLEWFERETKGKPANWLPAIRQAFLAGWKAGNDYAFEGVA